ncbi:uncharacterized protein LOC101846354 [Aplysia californica]|uniref:Uncharacterized protein LOC101846354 n=1 Tax=Aplysia californica TaxID=6500 RepID=A0ABM0JQF9_APLCA|nr:uncharacterized protein LOC101846354 [Aplysia californica]XP_005099128.1 uncharacterized protein LOC101846354 [Aplysia californica]
MSETTVTEISGALDLKSALLPPSTKDVLGEHLHQKVAEVLKIHFPNSKENYNNVPTVAKVTGMLLERDTSTVKHLLEDSPSLIAGVDQSLRCLDNDTSTHHVDFALNNSHLDYGDIGDLLYERVLQIDSSLAPQITGMLLELDVRTLITLLEDNGKLFASAVHKARAALGSSSSSPPPPVEEIMTLKSSGFSFSDQEEMKKNCDLGSKLSVEEIGSLVYQQAAALYPECASEITGMILEMGPVALQRLVAEERQIKCAVEKAFTAWRDNS